MVRGPTRDVTARVEHTTDRPGSCPQWPALVRVATGIGSSRRKSDRGCACGQPTDLRDRHLAETVWLMSDLERCRHATSRQWAADVLARAGLPGRCCRTPSPSVARMRRLRDDEGAPSAGPGALRLAVAQPERGLPGRHPVPDLVWPARLDRLQDSPRRQGRPGHDARAHRRHGEAAAQRSHASIQRLADRASAWFVSSVLASRRPPASTLTTSCGWPPVSSALEHPLADAVVAAAEQAGHTVPSVTDFGAPASRGVIGAVEGRRVVLGSAGFLRDHGMDTGSLSTEANRVRGDGATAIFVGVDGTVAGIFAIADSVKVMLTGDNRVTAEAIASRLGIDRVESEVLPDHKGDIVEQLRHQGRVVAMAGDGVNDAPHPPPPTSGSPWARAQMWPSRAPA